jgi:hypothetical protein
LHHRQAKTDGLLFDWAYGQRKATATGAIGLGQNGHNLMACVMKRA